MALGEWEWWVMVRSAVSVGLVMMGALWTVPTGELSVEGQATHYAGGKMAEVVYNKRLSLSGYVGAVALNRAGDVGRQVWLEWLDSPFGGVVDGPFLVVDCAKRGRDYERRLRQGYVVEVSEKWAAERGFAWWTPVRVRVWFANPWRAGGEVEWH